MIKNSITQVYEEVIKRILLAKITKTNSSQTDAKNSVHNRITQMISLISTFYCDDFLQPTMQHPSYFQIRVCKSTTCYTFPCVAYFTSPGNRRQVEGTFQCLIQDTLQSTVNEIKVLKWQQVDSNPITQMYVDYLKSY